MAKQTITIYDVAREAGVSMATVSRVVNGNPNVKPSTRKKVSDVIEKLNYRPNAVARGLASKKTTTVGVILPSVTNLFFAQLARGIDDIALMYKYNIILANSDESKEKEIQVFNTMLDNQVDGIVFMAENVTDSIKREIERTNTPVVFAGTANDIEDAYSVNIDMIAAYHDATSNLLTHKKRVALVMGRPHILLSTQQVEGYKRALSEHQVDFDDSLLIQGSLTYKDASNIVEQLLQAKADAAIIKDDALASAVMSELLDRGIQVPEDFEIISNDNSLISEIVRPALSSIQQPLYDIGAVAMRLLTKVMNNEEVDERRVNLPHKIKHRKTTEE